MIARSLGVQRALVAAALVHKGIPYMVNEFVLIHEDLALEVKACVQCGHFLLHGRTFAREVKSTFRRRGNDIYAWVVDEPLELAAAWTPLGGDRMIILSSQH